MRKYIGSLAAAALLAGPVAGFAATYTIDPAHTSIGFAVKHLVINNVKGSFKDFSGAIDYDGQDLGKLAARAVIKVASIDTGIKMRDDHLRSPEFFDAAKLPEITFVSERVEQRGDRPVVIGRFTMHGVTRQLELPVTVYGPITDPWGKQRLGLETAVTINRQDYGINFSQKLDNGGLVVGNEVKIEINLEAVLADAPAAK